MSFSVYTMAIKTFVPMLHSLSNVLDKGIRHAAATGLDPAALVNARLAPDMYPLAKQVQLACEHAHDAAAHLMGQPPPVFASADQTLDDLKARIFRTVDYLESAGATSFTGAEDRDIKLPLGDGLELQLQGYQYLRDWALPHFYFHVVTAYDILRHRGVEIGKRDYLNHVGYAIRRIGGAPP